MMTEQDIIQIIRRELKNMNTPIMMGNIVSNESSQRSTVRRLSIEGPIPNNRMIAPFGVSSRAPKGTECMTVPVNGDPTHVNVVGHNDKNRPEINDGELCLYDANGNRMYLIEGKIKAITEQFNAISARINLGSESSSEPLLLGNIVQALFADILTLIASHDHFGNLGYPTSGPRNQADFLELKSMPVDDGSILSDKAFTEK